MEMLYIWTNVIVTKVFELNGYVINPYNRVLFKISDDYIE